MLPLEIPSADRLPLHFRIDLGLVLVFALFEASACAPGVRADGPPVPESSPRDAVKNEDTAVPAVLPASEPRVEGPTSKAVGNRLATPAVTPVEGPPGDSNAIGVWNLRLEIPQESAESLGRDARAYVRARLFEGATDLGDVAVRLKGSAGSFQPLDAKPGFTVKMNQFLPAKRFHGMKKFLLNNCAQDPSYVSETLANELFRAAGIPAPRSSFARVRLGDRDLGFYVLIEAVTRDFLAVAFGDASGNLYEGPGDVTDEIDVDSQGGATDRAELRALCEAAGEEDPERRAERIGSLLDIDRFLSFLALEVLTWHWDGYALAVNNYRVYHDPRGGKLVFLPHGTDQLFQETGGPIEPEMVGLAAKAVLGLPDGRARYRARLADVRAAILDPGRIERRIRALSAILRPVLAECGEDVLRGQTEAAEDLAHRVRERARSVDDQLSGRAPDLGSLLAFDEEGRARLEGWSERSDAGEPALERTEAESDAGAALRISLDSEHGGIGSFRTTVRLEGGRYRFRGRLRAEGVLASSEESEGSSGACLRISGSQPEEKVLGDADWREFDFEFEVEGPAGERQLVCELRGAAGRAWFDLDSLSLERVRSGEEG